MIVTTSQKETQSLIDQAKELAMQIKGAFIPRKERSIERFYQEENTDQFIVITKKRVQWYVKGKEKPFFFHPGMATVRIKRLLGGDNDIMIQACQLRSGDLFLDCTMGLGADSIVASFVVGESGRVVGIESEPIIALLVQQGLQSIEEFPELDEAARRIEVRCSHHLDVLRKLPDKSYDVVYFDPMFRQGVLESDSLQVLRRYANPMPLDIDVINQARRVAKRRIVLKERRDSGEFERLGIRVIHNDSTEIAYGILET